MVYKALKKDAIRHFTSVRDPASFSSASKLRKHYFKKTTLRHVEDALQSVDAYTKHKPYKRRFPRRKTQTWGIDKQLQLDLIEMLPFKKYNKGYSYIMVAIDVFYRYAFAEAIKSKQGKDVTEAFKSMIKERRPLHVQTDKGKEFLNKHFKDLLKERGIPIKKGQKARILQTKKTFNRGCEPNWAEEIFTVKKPDYVRGYELEDALKEPIKGWFYRPQVQKVKVSPRKRYTLEKILKYRGKGSKREALIKWKGYGDKFNSWEPVKNIAKWI